MDLWKSLVEYVPWFINDSYPCHLVKSQGVKSQGVKSHGVRNIRDWHYDKLWDFHLLTCIVRFYLVFIRDSFYVLWINLFLCLWAIFGHQFSWILYFLVWTGLLVPDLDLVWIPACRKLCISMNIENLWFICILHLYPL